MIKHLQITCNFHTFIVSSVVREKVSREIFLEIFREIFLVNNFSEIIEKFLNKSKTIMNKKF